MCIAVYKPQGQKMPSKKIFSNCFANNDDGAGFMFPYQGKVHVEKGFMSFDAFKKGLKEAIKKYGISTLTTPMVFHFRITSQGGVKPELTHPFPLSRSYDEMRALKGDYNVACVHNGIIDFASTYKQVDYSDTMEFIKEVAFPLINKNPKYYDNKALMGLLGYLLSGNRFAIMDGKGHVELIGDWKQDKGIYYSNTSYEYKNVWAHSKGTTNGLQSTSSIFRSYENSFYDQDDYGYGDYCLGFITKDMEKEFLDTDCIRCDCGEEMIIEYLYYSDKMYAYCPDCGIAYKLTKKAEDHAWAKGLAICVDDDDYYGERSYGLKGV